MKFFKEKFKSVRVRLFVSLCIVVAIIVMFLIIINNVALESFYLYSKIKNVKLAYEKINNYYNLVEQNQNVNFNIEEELEKIAVSNDFDILVMNSENILLFSSDRNFTSTINKINEMILNGPNLISQNRGMSNNRIIK